MVNKKITVISGSRSEYGLLRPVMEAINDHKNLDLSLVVTGMHLLSEFGHTVDEIIKDGFQISHIVEMESSENSDIIMAKNIGKGIIGLAEAFKEISPDIVLLLGDRTEALASAIAAGYLNIIIAHIHGGDSSEGGLDECARHAITKFAHIHFPATRLSALRIKKMGEREDTIFVVGAPGLDTILNKSLIQKEEILKKYAINDKEGYLLVVQHPVSTDPPEKSIEYIENTLEAIKEINLKKIIICPNSDSGGREMIEVINRYKNEKGFQIYTSLPHKEYLSIMKYCSVLIGNSSSGIIESSSFKIPVINIGIRQKGREKSTNVIDVDYNKNAISNAIKKALFDKEFLKNVQNCVNPYGDGLAGIKIAKILDKIEIDQNLLQKKLTY